MDDSSVRVKLRNPRSKKIMKMNKNFVQQPSNIRESHRNLEFENREDLVDEKYRLQSEINDLRKENEKMKKEIREQEENYQISQGAIVDYCEKSGENIDVGREIKRILDLSKQYDDLNVLQNELDAQHNFLLMYYSNSNHYELAATAGLQSKKVEEFSQELNEMDKILQKATSRLNGPVLEQKKLFFRRKKQIAKLKKRRRVLIKEYNSYISAQKIIDDDPILPEELEAKKEELNQKLQVLQHRKYLRQKELIESNRRMKSHINSLQCLKGVNNGKSSKQRKTNEASKVDDVIEEEEEKDEFTIDDQDEFIDDNEEEDWTPFTLAKEAHE